MFPEQNKNTLGICSLGQLCVKCDTLDLSGVFLQIQIARWSLPELTDASCVLGCDIHLRKGDIKVTHTEGFMLGRGLEKAICFTWVWSS